MEDKSANIQKYKNKLIVSDLIVDVLCDKKSVAEALALFPKVFDDINIKCAFDALVHREADEDLRNRIKDYAKVQDEYLLDIAEILKKNHIIPKNIAAQYFKYHKDNLIYDDRRDFKSIFNKLTKKIGS